MTDYKTAPTGWQPIDTAPTDGTLVLLWCHGGTEPSLARFDRHWRNNHYGDREAYWYFDKPTHWMPVAEKPKVSQDQPQSAADIPEYTEGVCLDGAAILRDGVLMAISDILETLNASAAEIARLRLSVEAATKSRIMRG